MEVIFLLIPIALVISLGFMFFFFIAAKNGQFDDTKSPAVRILKEE